MKNMGNPVNYIAYTAGFGMGNFVGISLERKLSLGNLMVRVITHRDASRLTDFLRGQNYGITAIDAQGATGPVKIIFMVVPRARIQGLLETIKGFNPQAFYTVEDVRFVAEQNRSLFGSRRQKAFDRLHGFFLKKK
ncbi:MAG: DUF2179 domain-containing protein [Candidatus Omnitrophica bacterium]|nr:DUF2179 domain-containing protein [Candidatus Omnitrophota bacterium]